MKEARQSRGKVKQVVSGGNFDRTGSSRAQVTLTTQLVPLCFVGSDFCTQPDMDWPKSRECDFLGQASSL